MWCFWGEVIISNFASCLCLVDVSSLAQLFRSHLSEKRPAHHLTGHLISLFFRGEGNAWVYPILPIFYHPFTQVNKYRNIVGTEALLYCI